MGTGGIDRQPGTGGLGELNPGIAVQDLLEDPLILPAQRANVNGRSAPILGGIPLLAKLGQGGKGACPATVISPVSDN